MNKPDDLASVLKDQVTILGGFIAAMWVLEIADWLIFRGFLNRFGIRPRTLVGLRGILFSPFLHGNFAHLGANTIPFALLGWFVMLQETSVFWSVTLVVLLVSGLGVWLLAAPNTVHIGASGLIFGYLGFLVARGYFERSPSAIALSILALFLYGGMIWGVLPLRQGVSWEGHLFGFLGGILAAKLLAQSSSQF